MYNNKIFVKYAINIINFNTKEKYIINNKKVNKN